MNMCRLFLALTACMLLHACAGAPGLGSGASGDDAAIANLNLGVAYLREGRPEMALDALNRALRQNPRLATAHSTIALAYDQLNDQESAEEHYLRATQIEPSNAAAQNSYGVFLCRQSRWPEAERVFGRAIDNSRYPTPWVAMTNAGTCARGANDLVAAEQYFRRALDRNDRYSDALRGMMELSYQAGNHLQARAFMQRAFAVQKPDARLLWLCFHIEQGLDDLAAADSCAQQLTLNYPESAELAQIRGTQRNARQQ